MKTPVEVLDCSLAHIRADRWRVGSLNIYDDDDCVVGHCAAGLVSSCAQDKNVIGKRRMFARIEFPSDLDGPNAIVAQATIKALYEAIPQWFRNERDESRSEFATNDRSFYLMENDVVAWNDYYKYGSEAGYHDKATIEKWFTDAKDYV